jgi:hypothetical protein
VPFTVPGTEEKEQGKARKNGKEKRTIFVTRFEKGSEKEYVSRKFLQK